MSRAALVVFFVTLFGSTNPQTQDRPGTHERTPAATAIIVGQVVDAQSARGIPGAVVSLVGGRTSTR